MAWGDLREAGLARQFRHALFMGWMSVGMHEQNRHGADAVVMGGFQGLPSRVFIKRDLKGAVDPVTAAGLDWNADEAHSAAYDAELTADMFCEAVNRFRPVYDSRIPVE